MNFETNDMFVEEMASIEFFPQCSVIVQWWKNAEEIGDWCECAQLIRGGRMFCNDFVLDELLLLHDIARSRISVGTASATEAENERLRAALINAEAWFRLLEKEKAADECFMAAREAGDHE